MHIVFNQRCHVLRQAAFGQCGVVADRPVDMLCVFCSRVELTSRQHVYSEPQSAFTSPDERRHAVEPGAAPTLTGTVNAASSHFAGHLATVTCLLLIIKIRLHECAVTWFLFEGQGGRELTPIFACVIPFLTHPPLPLYGCSHSWFYCVHVHDFTIINDVLVHSTCTCIMLTLQSKHGVIA